MTTAGVVLEKRSALFSKKMYNIVRNNMGLIIWPGEQWETAAI